MIKVLILAENPEILRIYRRALEHLAAPCEVAFSVSEMRRKLLRTPFNGVILDVLTTVRASQKDKLFLQEISELYPTLRVRWDSRARRIRGLVLGCSLDRDDPVGDFLKQCCRPWPARTCREDRRLPLHLNALLSGGDEFREEEAEKNRHPRPVRRGLLPGLRPILAEGEVRLGALSGTFRSGSHPGGGPPLLSLGPNEWRSPASGSSSRKSDPISCRRSVFTWTGDKHFSGTARPGQPPGALSATR